MTVGMQPKVDEQRDRVFANEAEVIEALGGGAAIGRRLNIRRTAVSNWIYNSGIPFRQHQALVDLAEEKGVGGITHRLLVDLRRKRAAELALERSAS